MAADPATTGTVGEPAVGALAMPARHRAAQDVGGAQSADGTFHALAEIGVESVERFAVVHEVLLERSISSASRSRRRRRARPVRFFTADSVRLRSAAVVATLRSSQ